MDLYHTELERQHADAEGIRDAICQLKEISIQDIERAAHTTATAISAPIASQTSGGSAEDKERKRKEIVAHDAWLKHKKELEAEDREIARLLKKVEDQKLLRQADP